MFSIIKKVYDMVPESFAGEVPIEEVHETKKLLGVELPEDYIQFICMFGCGVVGTTVILGLGEAQFASTPSFVN